MPLYLAPFPTSAYTTFALYSMLTACEHEKSFTFATTDFRNSAFVQNTTLNGIQMQFVALLSNYILRES